MTVAEELHKRLHPDDPRTIPAPGFPSHATLVEWAFTQPRDQMIEAALTLILADTTGWAQQYAAMGLLRALGIEIYGEGYGEEFHWVVTGDPHV